jgi:hypothetical protein
VVDEIVCHTTASTESDCECSVGHYSENGNGRTPCLQCQSGEFQSEIKQNHCSPCTNGTTAPIMGSSSCDACQLGFFCTKNGVGSYPCPAGTRQIIDSYNNFICVDCVAGTFNPTTGISDEECTSCLAGHYCPPRSSESVPCPLMNYQDETGAPSCKLCEPGYFTDQTGQTTCKQCGEGFSCDSSGTIGISLHY